MNNKNKLSENERRVLLYLLDNAKATDSEIAGKIGITPQGVRKIRLKLEQHYIDQYRTIISYETIGIEVFAIAEMKVHNKSILSEKHIIGAFEVNESLVTHIFILGFSSLQELDEYKILVQHSAEIQNIYVVSKRGFLHNSPVELMRYMLQKKR